MLDPERREDFDQLLREAWSAEGGAVANSGIPCVMDVLNLMANVHNKKCVEELGKRLLELETLLKEQDKKKGIEGGVKV